MPTDVPTALFSSTAFAVPSVSEMLETEASDVSSVTSMVKLCVDVEPSELVAVTSIVWSSAVSKSSPFATVTSPVFASMAKKPPGFDEREYVTVSVTSASVARAVIPTAVPTVALSDTELADASVSEMAEILVSLTSLTLIVKVSFAVEPSVDVATTVMSWLVAVSASRPEATVTTPVLASIVKRPPASSERLCNGVCCVGVCC